MNNRLRQLVLENVALAILVGLLTNAIGAWIAEFFNDQTSVKQYKALSMLVFMLFTLISSKYLLKKLNLVLNKIGSFFLVLLVVLLEGVFFSVLPTKTANSDTINDSYPELSTLFEEEFIKKTDYNQARIIKAEVGGVIRRSPLRPNELHLLFSDIEWNKYENWRILKRNYRGHIKYEIYYKSNSSGSFDIESKMIDYSFRPGRGILSFIIGFIETEYLVHPERKELISKIEKIIRDKQVFEQLKELHNKENF